MASLISKIQTLINANLHSIVDRALERNSLRVYDEYLRQIENNLEALEDSIATVGGTVKTLKRKHEEKASEAEKMDYNIDNLIVQGRDELAQAAQSKLNITQEVAQDYHEQWQIQEQQYKSLLDLRIQLQQRLIFINQQRDKLQDLIELTEAKKIATASIGGLNQLAEIDDAQINSVADRIRADLDREDARLELATSNLSIEVERVVQDEEIRSQLEERRQRLGVRGAGP
ncbi:MAG: PspA/IM30 family protein [Anaerolineaceae bacterium]|nr:PspA/IM30 family protein [Chloroflexota bacterium]MCY4009613.1 PspA/IM30 family protein [Anaerolineaceae bacterium]